MVTNIEVKLKPGEGTDKLIRRFFKKCKKQDIVREHLDKTSYHKSRRQKRRDKILKNKFLKLQENS